VLDDNQTADTDLTAAKTLVQQDNVFAVTPIMTAALGGANFLQQSKVPFLGWSIEPRWSGLTWGFGFEGNDCDQATQPYTGDFPAVEQKLMTAAAGKPPDLIETVASYSDNILLYKKLAQLGYLGIVQGFTDYDPHLLGTTKGMVTTIQTQPFESASTLPAVQTMITDLKAFKPDITLSQTVSAGYWTADFFIQALKKAGQDLSREAFYNAINGGFTYDFNGGGGLPVQWPLAHTFIQVGEGFVQDNGTSYTVAVPLTPVPIIANPGYKGK
jgi:hypothetical protein